MYAAIAPAVRKRQPARQKRKPFISKLLPHYNYGLPSPRLHPRSLSSEGLACRTLSSMEHLPNWADGNLGPRWNAPAVNPDIQVHVKTGQLRFKLSPQYHVSKAPKNSISVSFHLVFSTRELLHMEEHALKWQAPAWRRRKLAGPGERHSEGVQ